MIEHAPPALPTAAGPLVVFGERATAAEIGEAVIAAGAAPEEVRLIEFPADEAEARALCARLVSEGTTGFVVGFTARPLRAACLAACLGAGLAARTVVHPRAWVSPTATLETGVYVGANATVSTGAVLGARTMVLFNATVGHDARVGEDVFVLPGARISGHVRIGDRCLLGSNCFVHQGVTIGDEAHVDALTYVRADLPSSRVASSRQVRIFERVT